MFDGRVPEQLRRFISSPSLPPPPPPQPATARALHSPLSFPASFETTNHFLNSVVASHNHKIIHHHDDIKDGGTSGWMDPTDQHSFRTNHDDGVHHHHHPWSSDEVLALLRLRSTVENWFPEFTWEHISRKLTEVGFKRSPQECKEKFEEEERRYFNDNNSNDQINDYNNSSINKGTFRMFSELEEFYHHHHRHHEYRDDEHASSEVGHSQNKRQKSLGPPRSKERDREGQDLEDEEEMEITPNDEGKSGNKEIDGKSSSSSSSAMVTMMMREKKSKRKRKKEKEGFEMLKGFCESLVRSMISQQEEMHRKILEDMVKRDEEKIAREEAWKKQETERIDKELEIRAQEHYKHSSINSTIINFITKFTPLSEDHHQKQHHGDKVQSPSISQSSSSLFLPQTPTNNIPTLPPSQTLTFQNPLSLHANDKSLEPISVQTLKIKTQNPRPPKSDMGKRWPRDEVLALVNIRCSISVKNGDNHLDDQHDHKEGSSSSKALPLWERISKKMLELGYKRSAKRCKEKWENINKYFRKTKDVDKKRPLDSRTCPYFHQLSALYSRGSVAGANGTITGKSDYGEDPGTPPEETQVGSLHEGPGDDPLNMHVTADGDDTEKNTAQASGFDF